MSTVTLGIGPKTYAIACADGEEAHIERLGAMIAEKYALLGAARAPLEAQNLLFAALFLADELAEARKLSESANKASSSEPDTAETDALRATIAQLERDLEDARKAAEILQSESSQVTPEDLLDRDDPADVASDAFAEQLEALAARIEASAAALEAGAMNA
ncbi:MAG: cell division protein ZapA [Sphingomonadales bacterium]|nr:cell division protein ZapA [Sphingomonadales bacterium]NCQ21490.1 cell division protein ZapA [Sphingomonadales bacterium]NCT04277.1 cell division protein ZapA [Sphingomonadales bacterium]